MEPMDPANLTVLAAALEDLPLFPLPQVVLFPNAIVPLHVFEPRYRALVRECLATHKIFALARITHAGIEDANGNPPIANVVGAGRIVEHEALADGRSVLLLHGQARVRITELPFVAPYRRARAVVLEERAVDVAAGDRTALLASASAFAAELRKQDSSFSFRLPAELSPGALADHCAHHLLVDAVVRQELLEELDPRVRVRTVTTQLALQHAAVLRETGGVLH